MRAYAPGDYREVAGWYEARRDVPPPARFLPPHGLIVPGIAAGFLVSTDTPACWIDSVVSNPAVCTMQRGRALRGIASGLIRMAHSLGFEAITITTQDPGVQRFAARMAFQRAGNYAMMFRIATTATSNDLGKER